MMKLLERAAIWFLRHRGIRVIWPKPKRKLVKVGPGEFVSSPDAGKEE